MLFWITAACLTFGACLAILLPLAGRGMARSVAGAHDLEVYRDQLAEVERDAERGLTGTVEAEQARAEIGRRILRLGAPGGGPASRGAGGAARWAGLVAVLAAPLASWSIYAAIGSPEMPAQPLQERLARNPADSTIDELVARAEAHLAADPDDGQGWEVVAPIYLRMGRHEDAIRAYENANRLLGATAAREAGLGEALTAAGDGTVSAEAEGAFRRATALEPDHAKARFYIASAQAQAGRNAEAAAGWRALIESAPADSPWRQAAEQALGQVSVLDARGPTQAQAAAAAEMSAQDRGAMIEGMVASLDERLRENPRDAEGWKRLVRSYMVLGKTDQARDALERGVEALGVGSDEAAGLIAAAGNVGTMDAGRE